MIRSLELHFGLLFPTIENPNLPESSKIKNRKLVGLVALIFAFATCGAVALAQ